MSHGKTFVVLFVATLYLNVAFGRPRHGKRFHGRPDGDKFKLEGPKPKVNFKWQGEDFSLKEEKRRGWQPEQEDPGYAHKEMETLVPEFSDEEKETPSEKKTPKVYRSMNGSEQQQYLLVKLLQ